MEAARTTLESHFTAPLRIVIIDSILNVRENRFSAFKNNHLISIESTVRFQNVEALIDFMQSYVTTHISKLDEKKCLHFFLLFA